MVVLKTLIEKHKWDITCYCVILIYLFIFGILYLGKLGNPIVDCGREAYIPYAILKGKVLYRDIYNLYGPLGYQFNALLYLIFGASLNVLYIAGFINTLLVLTCYYYILRQFLTEFVSMACCLLVLSLCCFSPGLDCNFILPYSYGTYYALTFFLGSFIFLMSYFKTNNKNFYLLSFLALGISAALKIEFILFLIVLIVTGFYLKPVTKKTFLISILLFFFVPMVSMGILFFQGLRPDYFIRQIGFLATYAKVPSMVYFLKLQGIYFNYSLMQKYLPQYLLSITIFVAVNCFFYLLLQIRDKFNFRRLFFLVVTGSVIYRLFKEMLWAHPEFYKGIYPWESGYFVGWMGLSCVLILVIQLIHYFKTKDKTINDKLFIILIISTIITNRCLFIVSTDCYSNFTFLLLLSVNIIFWIKYLPLYCRLINRANWQDATLILIICLSVFCANNYFSINFNKTNHLSRTIPIITRKGIIYANKNEGPSLCKTIDYINANFPKNAKFVMFPEGLMLNFLTERESNGLYYCLIPPVIEAFGEKRIIKNLSLNLPDYIIVNNINTFYYKYSFFGKDYAHEVMKFIEKEYNPVKEVSNEGLKIKIYKKKERKCK